MNKNGCSVSYTSLHVNLFEFLLLLKGGFVDDFNKMSDMRNIKSLEMFKNLNDKRLEELMEKLNFRKMIHAEVINHLKKHFSYLVFITSQLRK